MVSALLNPQVIDSYLQSEVQTGRVAVPFSPPPLPVLHVSRFGVILKRHQPGKRRLILDLSSPADASAALGYGAVLRGHWFSGAWLPTQVSQSIEYKELFPIVVAAYLWGPQWASKREIGRASCRERV